jgi:hypothetical protein
VTGSITLSEEIEFDPPQAANVSSPKGDVALKTTEYFFPNIYHYLFAALPKLTSDTKLLKVNNYFNLRQGLHLTLYHIFLISKFMK